jgi:ATP-binding cassette, subfamily B, bacterial
MTGRPRPERRGPEATPERIAWPQMLKDLRATVALVSSASPLHASVIVGTALLQSLIPAATLWVSKLLLDNVALATQGRLPGGFGTLATLLGLQVAIGVLGTLLASASSAARELLGDALQAKTTALILAKASSLEVERFENAKTYDALQDAYREVNIRPITVAMGVVGLAQSLITLVSIGALLALLEPLVLLLVLLSALPGVIVSNRFGAESYWMIRRRTPEARIQNYLATILTSDQLVKEVRLFGFEHYLLERWQEYYQRFRAQYVPLVYRRSAWTLGAALLSALLVAGATLQVLAKAAAGKITVGDFSLFIGGLLQVQSQFSGLLSGISNLYQNLMYMRNLFEFLELKGRDLDAGEQWQGEIESIEFQNVGFRYPGSERDVLKGASFKVTRGHALALVGENGAGKTTIVKLLTRLYEPTSGSILLNGLPASNFSPRSVQQAMSIIFQDYGQFQMTARENIALSDLSKLQDEPALASASARSGADDFLKTLPDGYDTVLGRLFAGGRQLSGGQWQRMALSRLYFRDASVIVFDEPTAALDAQAEFEAIEALRQQASNRIAVLISHRFSTVRLADQIVVLEEGKVSESGSHSELLAQNGVYAQLFRLQARGYVERV